MSRFFLFLVLCLVAPQARADFPVLDPNVTPFPRASLVDFSDRVPAPAGTRGFLKTVGSHFEWSDGTRARFWGINVANTSLQESDASIVAMLRNFRAAGFNLVRLHHFDERGGIIDQTRKDSRHFNAARLKKLDFWIAKARENGLYVYLDLLDYRQFKTGDGVQNAGAIGRSAKPYAVFDPKLLELQKEYARALMKTHRNFYTGLNYTDDPAIAMLEIYDENGLFMRRALWRSMPEPYARRFQTLWNGWLRSTYGSDEKLRAAWTKNGLSGLGANESLEKNSVEIPAMTWTPDQLKPADRPFASSARKFDGARFAFDVHRRYFGQMKAFLRGELKIKVPLCATGRYDDLPDLASQSQELDFIGCNFYYDHPYWGTGKPPWQLPSYYHGKNPLSDLGEKSMAATLGLARVGGKPFVVREWNYCWPNTHRAAGVLEAATFGAMQDIDAMILFVYETDKSPRLGYFNVRSDPARWGMAAMGGRIFMESGVSALRNRVVVPHGGVDLFTYEKPYSPLYNLGWTSRVENAFYEGERFRARRGTDLILPPGRSAQGRFSGAPMLLYGRDLRSDGAGNLAPLPMFWRDFGLEPRATSETPSPTNVAAPGVAPSGNAPSGSVPGAMAPGAMAPGAMAPGAMALDVGQVRARGWTPVDASDGGTQSRGLWDAVNKRLAFTELGRDEVVEAALAALRLGNKIKGDPRETQRGFYRSDTGEVRRDAAKGRFDVLTEEVQVLAGDLEGARGFVGGLGLSGAGEGAIVALSLDGRPLVSSQRFVIRMGVDAHNRDEIAARDPRFPNGQFRVDSIGIGPVVSGARENGEPLEVRIGETRLLRLWQGGGSWELLVEGKQMTFWCDTPGAKFWLGNEKKPLPWRLISQGKGVQFSNSQIYPPGALGVQSGF
jgi:hypothetical protein